MNKNTVYDYAKSFPDSIIIPQSCCLKNKNRTAKAVLFLFCINFIMQSLLFEQAQQDAAVGSQNRSEY